MGEYPFCFGIGGWLRSVWEQNIERRRRESHLLRSVEHAVDVADPVIRQARKYRKILQPPVESAMQYCGTIIDSIPGPVELSRRGYNENPSVRSLFNKPEDLEDLLRISPETKALSDQGYEGDILALLTMTRQEVTVFGHQEEGGHIMRDVPQKSLNFIDHRIVAPAADLDKTKDKLINRGIEVLATLAMEEITSLRARKAELQEKKQHLLAMRRILGGKSHMIEMFAIPDPKQRKDIRKVETALEDLENELTDIRQQIETPEQSLGYLENKMRNPDNFLVMQNLSYRLDWKNVLVDDMPDTEGNDINLAEFSITEELRRSAIFVSFSLQPVTG